MADDKPKTRSQAPRSDRVRKRILAVALESFSAQGFSGASTRSIAKAAGIRHSLVNYHFENKENLWKEMMAEVLGDYFRRFDDLLQAHEDVSGTEKLRLYIQFYAERAAHMPEALRIMTEQGTQNSSRLDWLVDTYVRDYYAKIIAIIEAAQREGGIIPRRPEHIYYLVISSIGTWMMVPREYQALTGLDPLSPDEIGGIVDLLCGLIFVSH